MSSAPAPAEHSPASTARSSSSETTALQPSDEKTVVSRVDSAPAVAPPPSNSNGPGPGATPTPAELELQKEADAEPEWPPPGMKLGANPTVKNFEAFWKPFRAALLVSDTDALAKVTRFPLRALSDSDPTRSVERAEFPRLVRRLLAQDTGLEVGGHESLLELVKRLRRIPPDFVRGSTARVGALQFAFLDPDGWRFESAWVNDIDESK